MLQVGIVNNNLGNTYTLQARQLAAQAAVEPNRVQAGNIMEAADEKFADAVTCFQLAIDDAEMLCSEENQRGGNVSTLSARDDSQRVYSVGLLLVVFAAVAGRACSIHVSFMILCFARHTPRDHGSLHLTSL